MRVFMGSIDEVGVALASIGSKKLSSVGWLELKVLINVGFCSSLDEAVGSVGWRKRSIEPRWSIVSFTSSVACNVWKMALAVDVACLATLKIFVTIVSTKSIRWLKASSSNRMEECTQTTYPEGSSVVNVHSPFHGSRPSAESSLEALPAEGTSSVKRIGSSTDDWVEYVRPCVEGNARSDETVEALSLSLVVA